jgi:hypothetical protein
MCEHGDCNVYHTDQYCPPLDYDAFPECSPEEYLGVAWGAGRFFEIHVLCDEADDPGWWVIPHNGRPLICVQDTDCPQLKPGSWYECANGLCQNTDQVTYPRDEVTYYDALTLCIGALPRTETVDWPLEPLPGTNEVYDAVNEACPIAPEEWAHSTVCTGELPDYCLVP